MRDRAPGKPPAGLILRLAVRNLVRHRRRTVITTFTVAAAVFLVHLWNSMLTGLERQSFENLIRYHTAHAKVLAPGWQERRDELPLDLAIDSVDALRALVTTTPGVAAAVPRLAFQAYLSDGRDQIPVQGLGIDAGGGDESVFRVRDAVVAGRYLGDGQDELLLGSGLARAFDANVGAWLTVVARTRAGAWEARDLRIAGVVATGNPLIDQNSFLMPLESARDMLDMNRRATELAIRFAPAARESRVLARLEERVDGDGDLQVAGWREQEAEFIRLSQNKRGGGLFMLGIFVVVALVGIANTMLLAAFERTKEIGMLLAMGMRPRSVQRLFLLEGSLVGFAAAALGTLLALGPILYWSARGVDLTALFGDIDIGYPVRGRVFLAFMPWVMVASWFAAAVLAALATMYPARRASRLKPAEVLRDV